MSVEELDENEQRSFLVWRRRLARLEENENLILTPFEKNLDIWRQLWRVDIALVNKADLLPVSLRAKWAEFFQSQGILFLFWSAKAATAALEGRWIASPWITQDKQWAAADPRLKVYGREELLARLQVETEEIVKLRRQSGSGVTDLSDARPASGQTAAKSVTVGFIGYPNVGKTSTINALVSQKRTGVTSTPGKTKHFQTLIISEELTLCDCPGMTEHREAIQVVANRVPRHVVEDVYNIKLPKPKPYEPLNRPPLASELLRTYCASRGREENNEEDAAGSFLPEVEPEGEKSDLESSGESDNEVEGVPVLDQVLNDLNSFDMENGLLSRKPSTKKPTASHKHHKKVQSKKDRSWRVGNDDGDGMPVVRAFQKPINRGPEVTR
ncbi:hypothetical protein MLD38_040262 [Melastoma candidum]|uniref:Uncharacterized protein n=1 Tax=Melastoma candidum TaxID=119954 RepID=A0ACB9L5V1_9MYRT|nr:hypothetical protein MLD38_040262 [Melastoma candidum]